MLTKNELHGFFKKFRLQRWQRECRTPRQEDDNNDRHNRRGEDWDCPMQGKLDHPNNGASNCYQSSGGGVTQDGSGGGGGGGGIEAVGTAMKKMEEEKI
jgi:hypothetical protein